MGNFTKPSTLRDSHEILKVTNLSKSYKNKKVLREINLIQKKLNLYLGIQYFIYF